MLKCSGCGALREGHDICFCTAIVNANGDPCGSLMFPVDNMQETIEARKPRKEGK